MSSSIDDSKILYRDFNETAAFPLMIITLFADWILSPPFAPIRHGFIRIDAGKIIAVGHQNELPTHTQPDLITDIITPGLINTHTHLDLTDSTPIAKAPEDTMSDWLLNVIRLRSASETQRSTAQRCQQGVQRMLETGVTTVNDIAQSGDSGQAILDNGLRGIVSFEFFHPRYNKVNVSQALATYENEFAPLEHTSSRLALGLSPHSLYNVSPKAWQTMVKALQPTLIHTHLAECQDERDWLLERESNGINEIHQAFLKQTFRPQPFNKKALQQKSPHSPEWQYIQGHHLLTLDETPIVFAHGSLLTAADLSDLGKHRHVSLAHCPVSNEFLHQNTLQLSPLEHNVPIISLGTDSSLSHPSLDIRDDARRASQLQGWTAETALQHLTDEGARALHLEHRIGSMTLNHDADLVCWGIKNNTPTTATTTAITSSEAYTQWLSPSTTAQHVMVAGRWCYQTDAPLGLNSVAQS